MVVAGRRDEMSKRTRGFKLHFMHFCIALLLVAFSEGGKLETVKLDCMDRTLARLKARIDQAAVDITGENRAFCARNSTVVPVAIMHCGVQQTVCLCSCSRVERKMSKVFIITFIVDVVGVTLLVAGFVGAVFFFILQAFKAAPWSSDD